MKTSLTSGQLKNHSRINRCPNDLQNQEIRTPSCCRTQPVSLGTKLNQSKIADMPWQLQMNLWPIMKWFPVCMAYKIMKSLVSSYGRMMCLFKRSLQVWQKVTLHLASWSSRTTWHQGAHLSQSPKQFHFIQRIQRQSTSCIFRLYIKAKSGGSSAGALFELKQYIFLSNTSYLLPLSSRESCLVRHAVGHHDLWSTQLVLADQHPD